MATTIKTIQRNPTTTTIDSSVMSYISNGEFKPEQEFHPDVVEKVIPSKEELEKLEGKPVSNFDPTHYTIDIDKLAVIIKAGYKQPVSRGTDTELVSVDILKTNEKS